MVLVSAVHALGRGALRRLSHENGKSTHGQGHGAVGAGFTISHEALGTLQALSKSLAFWPCSQGNNCLWYLSMQIRSLAFGGCLLVESKCPPHLPMKSMIENALSMLAEAVRWISLCCLPV